MLYLIVSLCGCASDDKINLIHMDEASTFADQKSVFYSNESLSDARVSELLKSRVVLPAQVKIAIIKLRPKLNDIEDFDHHMGEDPVQQVRTETVPFLEELINASAVGSEKRKIISAIVPESLVPPKANVKWIRNLGATMQADLVLVVDSKNDLYRDRQVIKDGAALSVSSADSYLIDTRTGIILDAKSYTTEAYAKQNVQDVDSYHTLDRARMASEKKIYKNLAADVRAAIQTR